MWVEQENFRREVMNRREDSVVDKSSISNFIEVQSTISSLTVLEMVKATKAFHVEANCEVFISCQWQWNGWALALGICLEGINLFFVEVG